MIKITDKSLCCGCGSCSKSCPSSAITMKKDAVGFLYPEVNNGLCVDCGICEDLCPVLNYEKAEDMDHDMYIAYARNDDDRKKGSSGGMFGLIAKHSINNGATVYGAAFDKELKLHTKSANTYDELMPLYKSKYLQNDLGDSFSEVSEKLENGEKVLFVSTPCQIKALKLYLGKEYENLLTVDFLCHGVPSQDLFDRCINYTEKKKGIKVTEYSFRSKIENGASGHYYTLGYKKGEKEYKKTSIYLDDYFYTGFQKYITLRDSCYDCRFAYTNRISDITLGDFHEVDRYIDGINRFDGVSGIVINSQKGRIVWEQIKEQIAYYPVDFKLMIDNGELMCGGTIKPALRDEFISDLENKCFDFVIKRYFNGKKDYVKKAYYNMPLFIRKILKKVCVR